MNVLVLDFETTGKEPKVCRPIEVACSILTADFKTVIESYSSLIYAEDYPDLTEEIELLTGISKEALLRHGVHPTVVFKDIAWLAAKHEVQYMVAYNREFDENVYKEECKRLGYITTQELFPLAKPAILPWLCAMRDVRSNYQHKCWKLSHLALEYGIAIDPKTLHRAMADVELTCQLLTTAGATAESMYAYQQMPRHVLEAVTKKPWLDDGVSTSKAKEKGYSWESPKGQPGLKYPKKWVKVVLEEDLMNELNETAFQVRKV